MAASLVQTSAVAVATGEVGVDPLVMTLTGVGAGNSILVEVFQLGALVRALSVSDNVDGAYTEAVTNNPGRGTYIFYLHNVTGGNVTITASVTGGSTMEAKAFEVSGLDPLASPIVGSNSDGSSVNTHHCAPSGSIDTSGATFVLAGGVLVSGSGVSAISPGGTYTQSTSNYTTRTIYQYKVAASALTDDRGEWSHTGTAREGINAMAAFPEASGGGPAEGAGTLALTIGMVGAGEAVHAGHGTLPLTLDLAGAGAATHHGTGALALDVDLVGVGQATHTGAGTLALALALVGTGEAPGVAAASGHGVLPLALDLVGTGTTQHAGQGALPLTLALTGTGVAPTLGLAEGTGTLGLALDLVAAGATTHTGAGALALSLDLVGQGEAPAVAPAEGWGLLALTLGLTGTGAHVAQGVGELALTLALTGEGAGGVPTTQVRGRRARVAGREIARVSGRMAARVPGGS